MLKRTVIPAAALTIAYENAKLDITLQAYNVDEIECLGLNLEARDFTSFQQTGMSNVSFPHLTLLTCFQSWA